ncbi:MAG: hypothetical protein ACREBQ_05200, partial [Nitrososphaerales archaeon]
MKLIDRKGSLLFARRAAIVALIIGIITASSYMSYASVVGRENLLAGHYGYSKSDYASAQFVNSTFHANSSVAADSMIADLYTGSFQISVNVNQGYEYLSG